MYGCVIFVTIREISAKSIGMDKMSLGISA